MIRLEVQEYCHNCLDFDADVVNPEKTITILHDYYGEPVEHIDISDTIVRCKYRNRCEAIKRYLKKGENHDQN